MVEATLPEIFGSLKVTDKILVAALTGLSLGEQLLDVLDELPTTRSVTRSLYTTAPPFKKVNKNYFTRALARLLESKYLEKEEGDKAVRYRITKEGMSHLFHKFPELKLKKREFDGFFRVVIYDVDEVERKLRREIRQGLRKLGFQYLQKSVWISPYDWEGELEDLFNKLKVGDQVLIFKSQLSVDKTQNLLKTYWNDLLHEKR